MLVISRTKDEEYVLDFSLASDADIERLRSGESVISICTVDIHGDRVRHGISAPMSVRVDRLEVFKARRDQGVAGVGL